MKQVLPLAMAVIGLAIVPSGKAAIEMPAVFSDHMVLQRDIAVPVWGKATPGETVTVKFRQQVKMVTAHPKSGEWWVALDPLELGEPGELSVEGSDSEAVTARRR